MNAKETRYVKKLEIEIEQLKLALKKSQLIWVDQFTAIYETKTALFQVYSAVEEAVTIIHECIKSDPQYMNENKRIEIKGDF